MRNGGKKAEIPEAMLRIGATLAVPAVLREQGADPAKVLAQVGLDIRLFDNPDNQISYRARGHLLQHCVEVTGCPHFGLLVGQRAGLNSLGLVGLLVRYSPDVGTALRQLVQYLHLHVRGATTRLRVEGDSVILAYNVDLPGVEGNDQTGDGAVAAMLNIMRTLCGPSFKPDEAWFAHPRPDKVAPYRTFFHVKPRFNAEENALVFSSSWLTRSLPDAEPELRALLQGQVHILEKQHEQDIADQVRRVLRVGLTTGHTKANQVAALLAVHVRTLHRRLTQRETSYQRLLDEVRFEVAQQLLRQSARDLADIAAVLGYADVRSFSRAFLRWSGTSPAYWQKDEAAKLRSSIKRSQKPRPSAPQRS